MIEKVNPMHPDKIADRIAGAIVDLAYKEEAEPKVAVEVLIGHGWCHIIAESSVLFQDEDIQAIVYRIAGDVSVDFKCYAQDTHLANNQRGIIKCGDNGIFKGIPLTKEQKRLSEIVRAFYERYKADGKYILDGDTFVACQSNVAFKDVWKSLGEFADYNEFENIVINPLGEWTGGINVDSGATNRKLGSDMADSVTGGGLHGKDLSKADVSVNIYAFLRAQETGQPVEISCAIGDLMVDGLPYTEVVDIARDYIRKVGGFEKFAEWGLY